VKKRNKAVAPRCPYEWFDDSRRHPDGGRGAHRLSRTDAGGDVIRRRWNNLDSMKDSSKSRDDSLSRFDDRDIVRSVSPDLKRLRSHQNALRAREAMIGVTSLERTPASILYNTIPCAKKMLAITPIRKRRFSMTVYPNTQFSSRIANG